MTENEKKMIKSWINVWSKAERSLEIVKKETLQSENYYIDNRSLLNQMLKYAIEKKEIKFTSGLVEMQKIFMKNKEKYFKQ